MTVMTDEIRRAVRAELGRRNWSNPKFADEIGVSRQYANKMLNETGGDISPAWQRALEVLGWRVVVLDEQGNEVK